MIAIQCDECKKPIDAKSDSFFDLPQMRVVIGDKVGQFGNLHFCSKSHLISWLQKNSEPTGIISIHNNLGPAS